MTTIYSVIYITYKNGTEIIGANNQLALTKEIADKVAERIDKAVVDLPDMPFKISFKVTGIEPVKAFDDINNITI